MDSNDSPLVPFLDLLSQQYGSNFELELDGQLYLHRLGGGDMIVAMADDDQHVVLHSGLLMLEGPRGVLQMTRALMSNYHQVETRGGAIGLEPDTRQLVFSYRIPIADASPETLLSALVNFSATCETLRAVLEASVAGLSDEDLESLTAVIPANARSSGALMVRA